MPYHRRLDDTPFGALPWNARHAQEVSAMAAGLYAVSRHAGVGLSLSIFPPAAHAQGQVKVSPDRVSDADAADAIAQGVAKFLRLNRYAGGCSEAEAGPGKITMRFGDGQITAHEQLRTLRLLVDFWRIAGNGDPLSPWTCAILSPERISLFSPAQMR